MRSLQTGNPHEMRVLAILPGPRALETHLHGQFKEQRENGEWFRIEGPLAALVDMLESLRPPAPATIEEKRASIRLMSAVLRERCERKRFLLTPAAAPAD